MSDQSSHFAARYVYAGMLVCIAMMIPMLWMPALLGALAQGFGIEAGALGRLASAELAGFLLGTLFTSSRSVDELQRWLLGGCVLLVGVNLALALFVTQLPFIAVRPLAGLASGIAFGFGLKLCALSARPTRYFGIITGLMSATMIVGFQGVGRLIALRSGGDTVEAIAAAEVARGVFALYALLAGVAAAVYLTNRPRLSAGQTAGSTPRAAGLPPPLVLLGLGAIVLSFTGQGGTWAFLQTLGVAHGFPLTSVANAMSAFAIFGIAGSLAAAALPGEWPPRWLAIALALLLLWAGLYALHRPQTATWYLVGCAIGGFYWNFLLPLVLGLLARIDNSGRASVLGGTMSSAGSALGPLLAGLLIQGSNYQPVGWMAGIACLLGVAFVWYVETRGVPRMAFAG